MLSCCSSVRICVCLTSLLFSHRWGEEVGIRCLISLWAESPGWFTLSTPVQDHLIVWRVFKGLDVASVLDQVVLVTVVMLGVTLTPVIRTSAHQLKK